MKKTFSVSIGESDSDNALTPFLEGPAMSSLIWDWEQHMRGICKHGSEEDQKTTWDAVREKWFELKNSYGIRDVA